MNADFISAVQELGKEKGIDPEMLFTAVEEAIYYNKEPKSGFDLAYDTIKIIYAAYKSAELGVAVEP